MNDGKTTVGAGIKFMRMVSASVKKLHIIASKTTGTAEKNIIQQDNGLLDLHRTAQYFGNGDKDNKLPHIKVGKAVTDTLIDGDGAFKISVDTTLSSYPIAEFVSGNGVEYEQSRGILSAVIFKTVYTVRTRRYILRERYGRGIIESRLYDENGNEQPLDTVPELSGIPQIVKFDGDYIMAVPLKFYDSRKFKGRGKSIFSGGKSDCFDALDEVISQWWDALRMGRVKQYIPEIPLRRHSKRHCQN